MSSLFNDADDDVSINTRRSEAPEYASDRAASRNDPEGDREVTLNTGMVLAIFFALALVCAVFFGLGYSMGRKSGAASASATPADSVAAPDTSASTADSSSKPAAGSPAAPAIPGYVPPTTVTRTTDDTVATRPTPRPSAPAAETVVTEAAGPTKPAPVVRVPPVTATAAGTPDGTTTYVQIAAVSHQEDADVLVAALRRRGYRVITRSEPTDKLIHVQIGPFGSRKDADATKQKLLADGYNAFLK